MEIKNIQVVDSNFSTMLCMGKLVKDGRTMDVYVAIIPQAASNEIEAGTSKKGNLVGARRSWGFYKTKDSEIGSWSFQITKWLEGKETAFEKYWK